MLAAAADAALAEKAAKARLALAADHFNRDYKKGFQFLQVRPLQLRASTCHWSLCMYAVMHRCVSGTVPLFSMPWQRVSVPRK